MKYSLFILILLFSFQAKASSENTSYLSGTVVDSKTKEPLQGASIYIHDIKVGTISLKDGSFKTSNLKSGTYLVEISYQGYGSIIENIFINGATSKQFLLNEKVVEQDAVTITGTTSATKVKNSPQPVSIVSQRDLFSTTSTNIIDALTKTVNGFSTISTGPAISKPIIRGLGSNRMVTINDGIRQEGQQWGDEHGIEIDENSVQKVEVLKGPASLMYGSDAIAGVLNIISNKIVQEGTIQSNFSTGYLDNNSMNSYFGNVAGSLKNGFNWNIYNSNKSAADYKNKYDGKVFNSRFNEHNFGGYLGINKQWGYSHLLVSSFNQKVGIVSGARDVITGEFLIFAETPQERVATNEELNSRELFVPYQSINHFKIGLDNNFIFSSGRLTMNIAYQNNKRKEFADAQNADEPELFFNLKTTNYNFQYHLNEKKGWKTSFGINGMFQKNENEADEVLIPEYKQFDLGGFVVSKKTFGALSTNFGLRYDYRKLNAEELIEAGDIRFQELNIGFNNFTGSAGLAYEINNDIVLKFNVARGFRAPNMIELSSNGAHEGTNRYEYGNTNLKSENSYQFDAGFELNSEHVSFSLNTFYTSYNNFIFSRKLSNTIGSDSMVNHNGTNLFAFQYQQSNATLIGLEANLDFHPHPLDWLHVQNSFSIVRGTFNSNFFSSNNLPFMPPARLLTDIKVDINGKSKTFKHTHFKFEIDNQFSQNNIFSSFNTETITPSFTLLNFGFGTDIKIGKNQNINLYCGVNNITDVSYQNHLSRLKYTDVNNVTNRSGVFNMGRNFNVKINIPLSFML